MAYLDRDGVRVHYEDSGGNGGDDRMPILLTHGFSASTGMWRGQVEALGGQYRLIRMDMRGHGETLCHMDDDLFSQHHVVEDMRALLDHLGIEKAVIGGHSLGGFMSLAFHVRYPDRVTALILQGCGPGYRSDKSRAVWNQHNEVRARTLEEQGLGALNGGSEVPISVQRPAPELAMAARGILSQIDARVIDSLTSIAVPTLVIIGDGDSDFLEGSNYMAGRIPGAINVVVPGGGHGINVDQPEAVNRALGVFLATL